MGSGYGPIVVAREPLSLDELRATEIVIPGKLTTAFLVLKLALGGRLRVPRAALRRDPARGRGRQRQRRAADPRGPADVRRRGPREVPRPRRVVAARNRPAAAARRQHRAPRPRRRGDRAQVSEILRESIDAALEHREEALEYALGFGRGMDAERGDRFIDMYVNEQTRDYGDEGRQAVRELLSRAERRCIRRAFRLEFGPNESRSRPRGRSHADRPLRRRARRRAAGRSRRARDPRGRRALGRPAGEIEDVYFGCANQAGEDNRNVARMAALLAGLPESVAGVTVNRLCASGSAAVVGACHAVIAGDGDLFVAGGVESMSRAPFVIAKPDKAFPRGNRTHVRHDARLALPESEAGGDVPARVDGRDGRERRRAVRRVARGSGRVRARVAAALGGGRRGGTLRRRARAGRRRRRATSIRGRTRRSRSSRR